VFNRFERTVAHRYLRARRGERFVSIIAAFSLIGIALGVATLIIVMSVMSGFRVELMSRILGLNGHLSVFGPEATLTDYQHLADKVARVPGVASALPVVEGQALFTSEKGGALGGIVRGMRSEDLARVPGIANGIRTGTLDDLTGEDAIAIGVGLARRFGLGLGDRVTLVSPQGSDTAFGTIPRVRAYQVAAIFEVGVNEYDTNFVFLPLEAAQLFFKLPPDSVTNLEVRGANPDRVGEVTVAIQRALSPLPVRVIDWQRSNSGLMAAVDVERNVMFLILTLIIVVAAFNIISSLIMMVKDKTRDIAVLRTLGADRSAIMRIFLMCGAAVGVVGTVAGAVIGVVFCRNIESIRHALESVTGTNVFNPEIYFLTHLPAVLSWSEVAQVTGMALALSLLATLYPSWRAARTDPVEALRHE
jgi:lipoprotein-releasing system permease protein